MKIDTNPFVQNAEIAQQAATTREVDPEVRKAAVEFEAYIAAQLFKQMESSTAAMGAERSLGAQFFGENFAEQIARQAAERGELGIADVLMRSWEPTAKPSNDAVSMESLRADFDADAKRSKKVLKPLNHATMTSVKSESP